MGGGGCTQAIEGTLLLVSFFNTFQTLLWFVHGQGRKG